MSKSLHIDKMMPACFFCSCYDNCVSVSASYNQWEEYICEKNVRMWSLTKRENYI